MTPFRLLTRTGWLFVAVCLVAVSGWVARWYFPVVVHGPPVVVEKTAPAEPTKEVKKWKKETQTRPVTTIEAPEAEREKAGIKPDEELLARGEVPPCPGGATVDAVLTPSGETRLTYTPKRPPLIGFLEGREIGAWSNTQDHHFVEYRQDILRIGQAHVAGRLFAENRRGDFGGGALVGVVWRF